MLCCTQQAMNSRGQEVAVKGVETQVVPVVRVILPHFVKQDHKLNWVL